MNALAAPRHIIDIEAASPHPRATQLRVSLHYQRAMRHPHTGEIAPAGYLLSITPVVVRETGGIPIAFHPYGLGFRRLIAKVAPNVVARRARFGRQWRQIEDEIEGRTGEAWAFAKEVANKIGFDLPV